MKKLNRNDYLNIFILVLLLLCSLVISFGTKYGFGSVIDWSCQHYKIPEYFRELFYSTGNLFPNFAFNLGGGQNIYFLSYYGLFNPVIMFSYLLPFVSMRTYITFSSIALVILSIFLLYKFINDKYDSKLAFLGSFIFICSAPIVFHLQRHIMFINYMPFLIMAFMGVDEHFKNRHDFLLIISVTLVILSSYFFSVSALVAISIYAVFCYLKFEREINFRTFFVNALAYLKPIVIAIMNSAILLIPTFIALLSGRSKTNNDTSILSLIIPEFNTGDILYKPYTTGLSMILIFAIIWFVVNKKKENKFLGITSLLIVLFPIFIYLLNGFMYVEGKVLITFLPLFILMIIECLNEMFKTKEKLVLSTGIFTAVSLIYLLVNFRSISDYLILFDCLFLILSLLILIIYDKKQYLIISIVLVSIGTFLNASLTNKLVGRDDYLYDYDEIVEYIDKLSSEDNLFRVNYLTKHLDSSNKIYGSNHLTSSIYSSLSNKYYKDFYYNELYNEVMHRTTGQMGNTENLLFNILMSNRYILAENLDSIAYDKVDAIKTGDGKTINVYENDNVLPIIYASNKIMSYDDYERLNDVEKTLANLNYVVVNGDESTDYSFNYGKVNYDKTYQSPDKKHIVLESDDDLENKIVLISFKLNSNNSCRIGDNAITINGIFNKLSCKSWKYHNKNYNFKYVIAGQDNSKLDITLGDGNYDISDLSFYWLDYSDIEKLNDDVTAVNISKTRNNGDIIEGEVKISDSSYIKTSIPYDNGFRVYVDDEEVLAERVNEDFLGFEISKGSHHIKIVYTAPGEKVAKMITFIGITISFVSLYLEFGMTKAKRKIKFE